MFDLWIIVCVFCSFSLTECQTVSMLPNTTDWFTALQTCEMMHGRLPSVNISNYQLKLQDLSVNENISSPFWIGATYDFLDINVVEPRYGYDYPYTCCEAIQNVNGNHEVKCSTCSQYKAVICVTPTNETNGTLTNSLTWHEAFLECKRMNLSLPARGNEKFLEKVTIDVGVFWLDGRRQINFQPDIGIQNRNCLKCLKEGIKEENCYETSITTVCIFDRESNTYTPSVNTEGRSKAGSLQTKTNDTGAVIGGVVGSALVAIVITVVIVILVRKHRSRKDNNDQREHQFSAANREKPGIMNSCFGVCRNSSLEKGNTKATNQAETTTDFCTQSQKHMMKEQQSSKHGKAVESTYERVVSVLYSVVQKDLKPNKTRHCVEQVKGSEENDEEYDKTSYCSKLNQAASSGNVYDKANFKHHDNSEYDSTHDIHFKHNGNSEYDTTKDMNFKHTDNSEYDMMKDISISVDATYDHV